RAMQEDPDDRYQSAADLRTDVDRIRTTPPVEPPAEKAVVGQGSPAPRRRSRSGITVLAMLGLVTAALVSGWWALREERSAGTPARNESGAAAMTPPVPAADRSVRVPATTPPAPEADKSVRAPIGGPSQASKEQPFENSLGMKFVPVPGTKVLFCIHETRYRDYEAYAEEKDAWWRGAVASGGRLVTTSAKEENHLWRNQALDGFTITDRPRDHPVTWVSWNDAKAFCEWLSKKEGRTYRLPTDAEWSLAVGMERPASAGTKPGQPYPWGVEWPPPAGAGNYSDQSRKAKAPLGGARYLEGYDDGFPTTAPVMSFAPNEFGLHDLGGNLWEWVEDRVAEGQEARLRRGGSWRLATEGDLRSSYRLSNEPTARDPIHGFRIVLVVGGDDKVVSTPPPAPEAEKSVIAPAPAPSTNDGNAPRGTPLPPEFSQRLDAYLAARRKALDDLAGRYTGALETRLSAAADAGNLALATAYEEEKARVEALRSSFGQTPEDAAAAVRGWPGLPALAVGTPDGLVDIRLVWETERGKIRADLDGKLAQSLQALESELTKARRLEEALAVKAHREGNLGKGPGAAAPAPKPDGVSPGRRFPVGTVAFNGRHFKVLGPAKTWNDARKQCKALDGRLAMPESAEENAFLMGLAKEAGLRMLWLGATDERIEGKWTSEGKEVKYSNWDAPVQPNNGGGVEHYAVIHSLTTGRWWDFPDDPIAYPNLTGRTIPGAICQWDE
ncbi:MAG TPA: SUMF1/EgtB/PvdO family nonheme iron enzyme, partial [Bacteroidia bacterium]|nr:SUMF1/EgtB/PvdO family nonheme iron enzyme [Bacteroidia bacterium]